MRRADHLPITLQHSGGREVRDRRQQTVLTVFVTLAESYFGSGFGVHCEVFVYLGHDSRWIQIFVPFCTINCLHGLFEPPGFNSYGGAAHLYLCFDQR